MRRRIIGLGLGIATLALATPAHAATLARSGTTLIYEAARGEENVPQVSFADGNFTINDGYDIAPGAGCSTDPMTARTGCRQDGVTRVILRLGDLDDEMKSRGPVLQVDLPAGVKLEVDGGSGKDRLIGTPGSDELTGGSGADNVYGSGGKDELTGGSGNDRLTGFGRLDGGAGNDFLQVFYAFSGEHKAFSTKAFGGAGNDAVLSGNKVRDVIDCGAGKKDRATTTDKPKFDKIKKNCEQRF